MVIELIARQRAWQCRWRRARVYRPGFYQRNTSLIIHDVQRLALQRDGGAVPIVFAVEFEGAEINALLRARAVLSFRDLAHALARRVIYVVGSLALVLSTIRIACVYRLALRQVQLVFEVPVHYL